MRFYVYILLTRRNNRYISYVGYTKNLINRLKKHNLGIGAKSTRGFKWKIIFKRKFRDKSKAMKFEYKLKKNKKLRNSIKKKYDK